MTLSNRRRLSPLDKLLAWIPAFIHFTLVKRILLTERSVSEPAIWQGRHGH